MDQTSVSRAARQELESCLLLGAEVIPAGAAAGSCEVAVSAHASPAPEASAAKVEALEALRARHDTECPHCTSVTGHRNTVFGEGSADARLMFVGEAPGAEEDRTGRPFVGRAGQKLDAMIEAMGLQRAEVYIANVLKSRPPNNRTPLRHEIDGCSPFLVEQIRIIRPDVLVTLGGPATKLMLGTEQGITRLRGQWATFDAAGVMVDVMPTFHPAYLLRNYTRETRERVWSDLQRVMERLGSAEAG